MKIFWISILFILLVACEEDEKYEFTVFELNQVTVTPSLEPFGVFTTSRDTILLNTRSLNDSRCPVNVTCVRYGNYKAELELIQNRDTALVSLCNGDCNSHVDIMDSTQFSLQGINYWIRMRSLLPFPNTARPEMQQNISFEIFVDNN